MTGVYRVYTASLPFVQSMAILLVLLRFTWFWNTGLIYIRNISVGVTRHQVWYQHCARGGVFMPETGLQCMTRSLVGVGHISLICGRQGSHVPYTAACTAGVRVKSTLR